MVSFIAIVAILIALQFAAFLIVDAKNTLAKCKTKSLQELHGRVSLLSGNSPLEYNIVFPYLTDEKGNFDSFRLALPPTSSLSLLRQQTKSSNLRQKFGRSPSQMRNNKNGGERLIIAVEIHTKKLLLVLRPNEKFFAARPHVERMTSGGLRRTSGLRIRNCHYIGHIKKRPHSIVAISNCHGALTGLIRTKSGDYFIEPWHSTKGAYRNTSEAQPHVVYKVDSVKSTSWRNISLVDDYEHGIASHHITHLKRSVAQLRMDGEDQVINTSSKIYLETVIAADHSVVKFHGQKHTIQYIMTLMNIVSTIYDDSSLDGNIDVVVVKILLVDKSKHNVNKLIVTIVKRNTRASLDNVCKWANSMHSENPSETYDIAIFLTRLDIGGPAGYAPLSSICNADRSCTVNKDEGLTSAFILAHEIGHVLGLSHDGDEFQQNNCSADGLRGSVMAPTVQSNFNRYYWSHCSKIQFHKKRENWTCMLNKPNSTGMPKMVFHADHGKYNLDEQCRQEFGDGYKHCKSFPISDPCTNLWCGHTRNSDVCKTKKGPPLDGTECGRNKWCVNGFCVRRQKPLTGTIRRNPRPGGWNVWSSFGHCSRSCGIGVQFRTRRCDNPKPAFGGKHCKGPAEEFKLCNIQTCVEIKDFRGEQCASVVRRFQLDSSQAKISWKPHASSNVSLECRLTCVSKTSADHILDTGENVVDGTLCSYNGSSNICVQGQCKHVGCDGILNSRVVADQCGVCMGNGSSCKTFEKTYRRTPKKRFVRIAVIPKGARSIEITKHSGAPNFLILQSRRFREFYLSGPRNESELRFIAVGALFAYEDNNGTELVTTTGPLLDELTVLVSVKRWKVALMVVTKYTLSTNKSLDTMLGSEEPYGWIVRGWHACSKVCGGGIHSIRTACFNKRAKKYVSKSRCSLLDKPTSRQRICNNFPCSYKWQDGLWEHCSRTCGTHGIQHREVHCVLANSTSVRVKPTLCVDIMPVEKQPCNVKPCPSFWKVGAWSQCSATCGKGFRQRNVTCLPPENEVTYDCGAKPVLKENCDMGSCRDEPECQGDTSEVCKMKVLYRYCTTPDFFNYCCMACRNHLVVKAPKTKNN